MSQKKLYVGIDIHSREHKVALIPSTLFSQPNALWGQVELITLRNDRQSFQCLSKAISSRVKDPSEVSIAVDHTGGHYSEPLVHYLQEEGFSVCYLETKGMKAARERFLDQENKTDNIDSTAAAYMLYLRDTQGISFRISETTPEFNSKAAILNSLVIERAQFSKLITQATNRLHQYLLAVFPEGEGAYFNKLLKILPYHPMPADILESGCLEGIKGISDNDKTSIIRLASSTIGVPYCNYGWLIREISTLRADFIEKRDQITSDIKSQVEDHEYGKILLSFPYLGPISAAILIGIIRDIRRWPSKKKLKKALGVYASTVQSGSTIKYRKGKEGNRQGKSALFQICFCCIRASSHDNDFRDYYMRQVAHGKIKMKALVSTMGKLAEIIYHCLNKGELYEYKGKYRTKANQSLVRFSAVGRGRKKAL